MTKKLSASNYYDPDWNRLYMSNSLYKHFVDCEARAMAIVNGTWREEETEAMLIGSYVHAALEGQEAVDAFIEQHPNMFTQKGQLYAGFRQANDMVQALRQDEFISFLLEGEKEVVVTAEMFGCEWKCKVDVLHAKRIVDIKTCRAIRDKVWSNKYGYCSFVEAYEYLRQLAIYVEAERRSSGRDAWLEPLIVAVSKEDPPDKEVIGIDSDRLQMELEMVEASMPRVLSVWRGQEEPRRCERCQHCRSTKRLQGVVHYAQLIG